MRKIQTITSLGVIISLITILLGPFAQVVYAAAALNLSDTMSSSKISTLSNHTIIFRTPTGVDASTDTITITFPAGFTMGTFALLNFDLDVSAGSQSSCSGVSFSTSKTLATAAAASTWGVGQSGQVVTLTAPTNAASGEIATNACVRIKIGDNATTGGAGAKQITNPSSAGSNAITLAGAFGDTGTITVTILTDDQVAVSATVDQSLTFTISDNSIGFGSLSATAARFATGDTNGTGSETEAHNIVVGTNGNSGYTLTVNGATLTCNAGSTCGSNTIAAIGASNTASSPGSNQFGLRATATGGSGAVSVPYAAAGFAFDTAAFPDEVAASTVASVNTTYSVRYLANIAVDKQAGAYSATLTYTATANF